MPTKCHTNRLTYCTSLLIESTLIYLEQDPLCGCFHAAVRIAGFLEVAEQLWLDGTSAVNHLKLSQQRPLGDVALIGIKNRDKRSVRLTYSNKS